MKKVMIAAAIAATLGAFGIESANTVGYQTMGLTAGKQVMKGAMFVSVGSETISLQDIRMDSATLVDGTTQIWWWDKDTRTYTYAYWCPSCNSDGDYIDENGTVVENESDAAHVWGDQLDWIAISKTFAPGEGFWIKPDSGAPTPAVSIAGELVTTDTTIQYISATLAAGKQVQITQPMPVGAFGLQTVKMTGAPADGGTQVWWWDKNTRTYTYAYWCPSCNSDGDYIDENGTVVENEADAALVWGDQLDWIAIEKTFDEGEAFWVKPDSGASSPAIQFPNPLYVAQ